jgi:hypothetical protein
MTVLGGGGDDLALDLGRRSKVKGSGAYPASPRTVVRPRGIDDCVVDESGEQTTALLRRRADVDFS